MSATADSAELETRIAEIERRIESTAAVVEHRLLGVDARLCSLERPPRAAGPYTAPAASTRVPSVATEPAPEELPRFVREQATEAHAPSRRATRRGGRSFSDVLGGQVLAWLGGVATLLGIVLLLAMAVSEGWIGPEARVLLAACASAALMAGGCWLHSRRGRTEAAVVMVGVATSGLFATLSVASTVYGLAPYPLALVGALAVGSLASTIAVRWAGRAIGALGLLGSLLAGVLVGAPSNGATIAILALAAACAMAVVVRQRWGWLALATVLICAPQWSYWVLQGQSPAGEVLVLVAFAALGLLGALAAQTRSAQLSELRTPALVACSSACLVAVVGRVALADAAGTVAANLWLAGLAGAHLALGLRRLRRVPILVPMRHLLVALGVALADVCFALSAGPLLLALGWSAAAVGFAWLAARRPHGPDGEKALELAVGVHIALALIRALIDAPPSTLAGGDAQLLSLLSVAGLAAACIVCGLLAREQPVGWRATLNGLGLAAIAYLTAAALDGPLLVGAWALEGLALVRLSARGGDRVVRFGGLAFIAGAAIHALVLEAPPVGLSESTSDLAAAAASLGVLAVVGVLIGAGEPSGSSWRRWAMLGAGAALLYLASLLVVSAFEVGSSVADGGLLELTVRQQAQVALSALWSVAGVAALIVGLRADIAQLRSAGFALLLTAVAKVFLFDLSTLTSVYRVTSFIVLGLLLLSGAFAYQRLRPPPRPDMRTLHPSQR